MLTVMCPNCRHRFPAPGCCNPDPRGRIVAADGEDNEPPGCVDGDSPMRNNDSLYSGGYLLVPRELNDNTRGCFINAPTMIHGPTIIQQPGLFGKMCHESSSSSSRANLDDPNDCRTGCDLTGGTVTITTPRIQSGGCLIRGRDTEIFIRSPRIEIIPKLTGGGGCYVQENLAHEMAANDKPNCRDSHRNETTTTYRKERDDSSHYAPPSGCQELPGTRPNFSSSRINNAHDDRRGGGVDNYSSDRSARHDRDANFVRNSEETRKRDSFCCCVDKSLREETQHCRSSSSSAIFPPSRTNDNGGKKFICNDSNGPMEIRVNATVQLPPNVGRCTVNITATTGADDAASPRAPSGRRDNFNGGGLVQLDSRSDASSRPAAPATTTAPAPTAASFGNERRDDNTPTTPLSWLMPCSWGFDNYPMDKDVTRLTEIKRLLHIGGWYHEGLCWQQSETLLKNTSVGRWLMRDSSDSRFIFAVSVQTARGPTSVRVHYFFGKFRLDAEPRLSLAMPLFDCPIKMLQHYVDYSKRIDEHREEVWVDYNGQLYSQIYLTKPLVKEVQTLSHLARIVVNSNRLRTDHLPPLIKNYLAEYPYSL